ncbi:MAG: TonB-dependent receptor [Holophaga sp.]|nr:TonB-dependent receptor [Holophaga sp.]
MSGNSTRILAGLAAGLLGGTVLMAQQSTGTFKGRVTDKATGAPKAGVTVTAENVGTGFVRTTTTNAEGMFRLPVMPLGSYRFSFKSVDSVASLARQCTLGQEVDASVAMAPALQATVAVVATVDSVSENNVTSAEVGVNVSAERLESLPVLSRNVVQAAVLAPGVQLVQGGNVDPTKKASTYMTTGDGQGRGTNFNIDGGDNNSTDVGGYVSSIPIDAVGEFQVVTNQYKAEFGRSNAGFLNVVSKAGSNAFSGVLSAQFTNQALRAMTADEGDKKDSSTLSLGATVAGPMLKDKLFFMVSAEKRKEEGASATFAPAALTLFPEGAGIKTKIEQTTLYTRFDWNATSWLQATLTYSYDKNTTPNQSFGFIEGQGGNGSPSLLGGGTNEANRGGLKFVTNIGTNTVWESNFVYFDYKNNIRPNPDPLGKDSYFFVLQRPFAGGPAVDPNTALLMGFDPNSYQNTGIKRFQWRNDVTSIFGPHAVKTGFDFQHYTMADAVTFVPNTGFTNFRIAGIPYGTGFYAPTVQADVNVARANLAAKGLWPGDTIKQYAFYLQDDWTLNPKWTLYAGFRADKDTSFEFAQQGFIKQIYQDIYATSPLFIRGATPPRDRTYISPRLQIVWKPNGDDTQAYKVGYGRFVANVVDNITGYARTLMARANGAPGRIRNLAAVAAGANPGGFDLDAPSFLQNSTIAVINGHPVVLPADLTPYNYANDVNGLRTYFSTTVDSWLLPGSFSTAGKQLLASDFSYPETDTFSLSGAWKFGPQHSLEITYLYSKTKHASVNVVSDSSFYALDPSETPIPEVSSIGPGGAEMNDTIFYSNQQAESHQVQIKYVFTAPRWNALFNVVAKNARSSYGGAGGAFDLQRGADFYGGGTNYAWYTNPMRPAHGSEKLSGSFSVTYKADWGTHFGLLGTWHGPKIYDINLGYNPDLGPVGFVDNANPNPIITQGEGNWALDMSLRISHAFRFGGKASVEPFVQVQNLLNNYDYGSNYHNSIFDAGGNYLGNTGQRFQGFAINQPRTLAVGLRATF